MTIHERRATKGSPRGYVSTTVQLVTQTRSSQDVQLPRLREQRLKRAYSQQELADRSGLSRTTILKLEAGRDAWPQTARKLARALRIKVTDLY